MFRFVVIGRLFRLRPAAFACAMPLVVPRAQPARDAQWRPLPDPGPLAGLACERSHAVHTVVLTVDLSRCSHVLNSGPGEVFIQVY